MATPDIAEPEIEDAGLDATDSSATSAERKFQFSTAAALTAGRKESLESWHRGFLKMASGSLGELLRLELDLELASVQIQTYGEMIEERSGENHCVLFRMNPQPGIWLLDLPVSLSLLLVDRMMGGQGVLPEGNATEMTDLDQTIFQQFAETLLSNYARSWRPHADLQAEVLRQVRNLNYQLIHQPDELILRIGIQVAIRETKTVMWLVVPIMSVEDLLLRTLGSVEPKKPDPGPLVNDKKSSLGSVPVPVSIRWQGFQLTLRDVEAMAVGDVLMLDNRKCENAVVWLGDRAKFSGKVVREAQKTVVTINTLLE
jgi:flagellar motor switch protein FliM